MKHELPAFALPSEGALERRVSATGDNGRASISTIGQKFKASGHTVKESGHSTLTNALTADGSFEMKGKGAARYFRLKGEGQAKAH